MIRPVENKVVVKRHEAAAKVGNIELPESAKEPRREATVVAVGPGKLLPSGIRSPMSLKEGDVVLLSSYSGTEVKVDGVAYLVLEEDQVLGVLE